MRDLDTMVMYWMACFVLDMLTSVKKMHVKAIPVVHWSENILKPGIKSCGINFLKFTFYDLACETLPKGSKA